MTRKTDKRIASLFPWNTTWTPCENGFFRNRLRSFPDSGQAFIATRVLADIDPRLPACMTLLREHHKILLGSKIVQLLELWTNTIHLETKEGELVACSQIDAVHILSNTVQFSASGHVYTRHTIVGFDLPVAIPQGRDTRYPVIVAKAWIDAEHPGWEQRFTMASDIGLSYTEAVQVALAEPAPTNVASPPDNCLL